MYLLRKINAISFGLSFWFPVSVKDQNGHHSLLAYVQCTLTLAFLDDEHRPQITSQIFMVFTFPQQLD